MAFGEAVTKAHNFDRVSGLESKVENEVGQAAQNLTFPSTKIQNISTNIKNEVQELKKVGVEEIEKFGIDVGLDTLPPTLYKDNVNLAAGIPLLQKYDCSLLALHINNRTLFLKAECVSKRIQEIRVQCMLRNRQCHQLHAQITTLPSLLNEVLLLHSKIEELCHKITEVENLIEKEIENAMNRQLENFEIQQQKELHAYKLKKQAKLDTLQRELEKEKEKETERLRLELENKAKQEMVDYILWGPKKKPKSPTESPKKLEEITIESEDRQELEEFLGNAPQSQSTASVNQQNSFATIADNITPNSNISSSAHHPIDSSPKK